MIRRIKLRELLTSDDRAGLQASADVLARAPDEELLAIDTDCGVVLVPVDATLERAFRIYERGAHRYGAALRALAR